MKRTRASAIKRTRAVNIPADNESRLVKQLRSDVNDQKILYENMKSWSAKQQKDIDDLISDNTQLRRELEDMKRHRDE